MTHDPALAVQRSSTVPVTALMSWILLAGFFFISGMARGVYAAHGAEPSARFEVLTLMGMLALLWFWFVQQMRPHQPRLPMDMGVFLVALWFIFVPYYLWRYERWRGLGKVAALVTMYFGSWVISMVVYFALR